MNYDNDKLNEIYRDTWPNLGWAKRMNENYPDYMFEEAAKREAMAMEAVEKLYEKNGGALKQLAEIEKEEIEESDDDFFGQLGYLKRMEKEEAEQKVAREEVMKIAVGAINKYSEALKQLSDTEKVELREELEALKKENFQKVADCCIKEYEEKYGEYNEDDDYWIYMYSEYFATGEGQTVSLMVTQAVPRGDDYSTENKYETVNSKAYRAVREFHKEFGTWELYGLRFFPKQEFYTQCAYFIPPVMMKLSSAKCYKHFHTQVHYNFS
jgi:hypothetical protein